MRVVIQRCKHCEVVIDENQVSSVNNGMVIFVAVEDADTQSDIDWLVQKIVNLRIFDDNNGVMNLNIQQIGGDIMVISQFTLFASTKKGNRPSYIKSSKPDFAIPMYEKFISSIESALGKSISTGQFGADMKVELCNDGPVTIIIDSKIKE